MNYFNPFPKNAALNIYAILISQDLTLFFQEVGTQVSWRKAEKKAIEIVNKNKNFIQSSYYNDFNSEKCAKSLYEKYK